MKRTGLLLFLFALVSASSLGDEPDLSEIDANGNGIIEPQEISNRDMIVLSRYASLARQDLSRSVKISDIEHGRDLYMQKLQGSSTITWPRTVDGRQFGREPASRIHPFGVLGQITGDFTDSVRDTTIQRFQQFDDNRDGLISPDERKYLYREQTAPWIRGDRDGNGLLTFAEMATAIAAEAQRSRNRQAYNRSTWKIDDLTVTPEHRDRARRWMQQFDRDHNHRLDGGEIPDDWKAGNMLTWSDENRDGRITESELFVGTARWMAARNLDRRVARDPNHQHGQQLAREMIRNHDRNKDEALMSWEWRTIGGDIASADLNTNGTITVDELSTWLFTQLNTQPGAGLPDELPSWFLESDLDLDGQVLMSEFVHIQSRNRLSEFQHCDRNADGIVTAKECSHQISRGKLRFFNGSPQVIEGKSTLRSEIMVTGDIMVSDLDVHVRIQKDGDDDLQLRLVGPDGTVATLYHTSRNKPWGGGRLFAGTFIDDEAPQSSGRLPSPPSHRSFRSQGLGNNTMNGVSVFYGKPASGTWQLVVSIEATSAGQNAGLLQSWSLLIDAKSR